LSPLLQELGLPLKNLHCWFFFPRPLILHSAKYVGPLYRANPRGENSADALWIPQLCGL
jgi:hypothetical protein